MEVNKPEAERARDIGAEALRNGELSRAIKMLTKSVQLYPLPGVEALLAQAKQQQQQSSSKSNGTTSNTNNTSSSTGNSARATPQPQPSSTRTASSTSASAAATAAAATGGGVTANGRSYTAEQAKLVKVILDIKKNGGRNGHYHILGIEPNANDAQIKKAYRKMSLKVHPDKNGAPHADEAFKAINLANDTLSDPQKRQIYDRYGEEDPDNRGGGGGNAAAAANMARHFRRGGGAQEVSPEDIFNMFFGGGMPGGVRGGVHRGPGGFHVYSNGFGFGGAGAGGGGMPQGGAFRGGQRAGPQGQQQQQQRQQPEVAGFGQLLQLLPLILIMLLSFFNFGGDEMSGGSKHMPGMNKYFSLVYNPPFSNPLTTRLVGVKDIPYYVTDKFLRTYHRDRYQLSQVERMVERAYEEYLVEECTSQRKYLAQLKQNAAKKPEDTRLQQRVQQFELRRCTELDELFPKRSKQNKQQHAQKQRRYS